MNALALRARNRTMTYKHRRHAVDRYRDTKKTRNRWQWQVHTGRCMLLRSSTPLSHGSDHQIVEEVTTRSIIVVTTTGCQPVTNLSLKLGGENFCAHTHYPVSNLDPHDLSPGPEHERSAPQPRELDREVDFVSRDVVPTGHEEYPRRADISGDTCPGIQLDQTPRQHPVFSPFS